MSSLVSQGQALVKSGKATNILLQEVGKTGTAFYTYPYLKALNGGVFALKSGGD
jgi:arabinogalactan oligomer / maltooligosaccharide transport system substrate-binding protein